MTEQERIDVLESQFNDLELRLSSKALRSEVAPVLVSLEAQYTTLNDQLETMFERIMQLSTKLHQLSNQLDPSS